MSLAMRDMGLGLSVYLDDQSPHHGRFSHSNMVGYPFNEMKCIAQSIVHF